MSKPTIATLTATIAALEERLANAERSIAELQEYAGDLEHAGALAGRRIADLEAKDEAEAPALKAAPTDGLTLLDLAAAIADGSAITCLDRNRLSFRLGRARWRLKELPKGQTPQAAANRLRAHCIAGGRLQAPRWERIS